MHYFNISVGLTTGRPTSLSISINLSVFINERYFRFSHMLIYFLYKFKIIFLKSNLNHENHILSDIYIYIYIYNILKLVLRYLLFPIINWRWG